VQGTRNKHDERKSDEPRARARFVKGRRSIVVMVARLVSLEFALLCAKFCMGSTVGKNHRLYGKLNMYSCMMAGVFEQAMKSRRTPAHNRPSSQQSQSPHPAKETCRPETARCEHAHAAAHSLKAIHRAVRLHNCAMMWPSSVRAPLPQASGKHSTQTTP
jgi:hypothetical protein